MGFHFCNLFFTNDIVKSKIEIIEPYISIENNEARIALRVKDSDQKLRRNEKMLIDVNVSLHLKLKRHTHVITKNCSMVEKKHCIF